MNLYNSVPAERKSTKLKTLKAFTLIELIIVIAIISILVTMVSLFMPGFIRDANMETYNKTANLAYTGFQNILIKCEIYNDDAIFDPCEYTSVPSEDIEYATVVYSMNAGTVAQPIKVKTTYTTMATGYIDVDSTHYADVFKKLSKLIKETHGNGVTGDFRVFIDYENYLVDSVVYSPVVGQIDKVPTKTMSWPGTKGKEFEGCPDLATQKVLYRKAPVHGGYYPYTVSVDSAVSIK